MSDLELLQIYTRENSQEAFATLVERYVNLVYAAARRQVRSTQLAEDVAQSVFLDLARNANKIRSDQPLVAWLFLVTRRTAVDVLRRETRRQAREQTAAENAFAYVVADQRRTR
jgi:RNA polymerase sigma factor (sigma-70 family)